MTSGSLSQRRIRTGPVPGFLEGPGPAMAPPGPAMAPPVPIGVPGIELAALEIALFAVHSIFEHIVMTPSWSMLLHIPLSVRSA